jgi:glycosyltransferase involved in cell wall biosynthesis
MEAALCGCPSVVAPAGAIPEICRDSVLYADIGAAEDWCSAILTYRAEPDLRAQKIALSRNRAEHFTWSSASDLLAEIVTGALGSSGVAISMEPSEPVRSIAKN